ncbi:hypothetical protein FHL15_009663 [Xylaria flabelliformis]|uniref:Uncharacterized protein n=1 Tax=Xylaria flabelliformis TaxID=2512241 RepID=A0A553HNF5_9PEZI|nr:hypothetical protein FHL15_009663 [Xylaria flabelliformis]
MQSVNEWWETPTSLSQKRVADEENPAPTESKRRKRDCETYDEGSSRTGFTVNDYTIGWVCALHIELAAASSMLDTTHDDLVKSRDDSNTYTLGSLHHHNVVIACLPTAGYGTNNAAIVANNMRRTFPSIQMFLMVGIGGGVPGKVDIRLGDVVVSTGVMQYDLGKTVQQGHFQPTGSMRQPSPALMTAVSTLRAQHELKPSKISLILSQIREQDASTRQYTDHKHLQDSLFDSAYEHSESIQSCTDCDRSRLVDRPPRSDNSPMIHYGIIASGNQVIKHAKTRDRLAQEFDAICFEMEAAGLMDSLQCLVIRGICDYSDSHKSKQWQKYASATAAAYAKELLSVVPTIKAEAIPDRKAAPERRRLLMDSLLFERIDARHSNIRSAYGKTCAWLLSHPDYIKWLTPAEFSQHHGLLWIYGKPGAGKSTIMKYIYTRALGHSDTTISFFFNARGDDLEKSTQGMYRSLLFQLLEKLPDLQEVLDLPGHFSDNSWEINVLQSLFSAAIAKLGRRRVTCFVDALDECGESQVRDMVEYFEQLGQCALETEGKLYICFSSRHYPTICIQNGQTLTLEDQPGHSQDLEKYVRSKLRAGKGKDVESIKIELLQKAAGVFMWVVLVVNVLNNEFERGRIFAVKRRLQETPAELSELFKDILRRDNKNMADLLLSIQWILYAKRPMKLEEFYYAVVAGLDPTRENLAQWNPEHITVEDMNRFVCSSSKGLAEITKSKAQTVQFIHESVRDFLLKDGGIHDLWPNLEANFESLSHDQLKKSCYEYLLTDMSNCIADNQELPKASSREGKELRQQVAKKFPFLEYATQQVLYHADMATIEFPQHDFLNSFNLKAWIHLDNLFAKYGTLRHGPTASLPYILAEKNFARLIGVLCWHDTQIYNHDYNHEERYGYPLFAALANGHPEAFKALMQLQNGLINPDRIIATISYGKDFKFYKGQTLLLWAIENGHHEIVQLLIEKGADVESEDSYGYTPLHIAAENGHQEIVQLLIEKGANVESANRSRQTPLLKAVQSRHQEIMKLLIEKGANVESKDSYGYAPLHIAAENGHQDIIKLLIEKGANVESRGSFSRTPLLRAAMNGRQEIVKLLIESGANVKSTDDTGDTPLSLATYYGHQEIVRLLIEAGADQGV